MISKNTLYCKWSRRLLLSSFFVSREASMRLLISINFMSINSHIIDINLKSETWSWPLGSFLLGWYRIVRSTRVLKIFITVNIFNLHIEFSKLTLAIIKSVWLKNVDLIFILHRNVKYYPFYTFITWDFSIYVIIVSLLFT